MIKVDLRAFDKAVDLHITRAKEVAVEHFREVAMEIFWRILHETPQFTGKAVAHWQVGIDAPDLSFRDDSAGDFIDIVNGRHKKDGTFYKADRAHVRGDDKWINVAWVRNEHKFMQIKRGSKVYFSNSVRGDRDMGKSDANYLTSLQQSGYWMEKLRSVNKPYETAAETIMLTQLAFADAGAAGNGIFTFRRSRKSYENLPP